MKQKIFFFGFGSLCTYQYPALKTINRQIPVEGIFYQTRKEVMPENFVKPGENFLKVYTFGTEKIFKKIPRPLFRLLENIYIFFSGLRQIIKTDANQNVFVSGYIFFLWIPILRFRFRRVVVWKFGVAEEFLLRDRIIDKAKFLFIKGIERHFLPMADAFIVQSGGMTKYVRKNFKAFSKPIYKIPCCVDYNLFRFDEMVRQEARKRFGIEERFVVTHIGSGSAWRANDNIIKVFKAIKSKKENAFLLIVSRDPVFKELISRHKITDAGIMSFPHHEEVAKALQASDLALLLNFSDHNATEVMSPIKFPEYLAAGLPIIAAGTTKEYIDLINKNRIGFGINMDSGEWDEQLFKFLDYLGKNRKKVRKTATAAAKLNLSWQCMQKVIDSAFNLNRLECQK